VTTGRPRPYLRASVSNDPLATGWTTHPAGSLNGVRCDVVFDPARHDICRALTPLSTRAATGIRGGGFRLSAVLDSGQELWVRERSAATRATLAGLRCLPGGAVVAR
jgi:hypothetical protein